MAIEVEVRGPLSKEQYSRIKSVLETKGKFKKKKERTLVNFSDMSTLKSASESLDIRARITNGVPEMILKKGKWGAQDAREEISVLLQPGQFNNLLKAYAALGFKKGILAIRNTMVYDYQGVEFSLVEVPGHSYFFEAEKVVEERVQTGDAQKKIKEVCSSLGLSIFSDKQFFEYVDLLDKEANKNYNFDVNGELDVE